MNPLATAVIKFRIDDIHPSEEGSYIYGWGNFWPGGVELGIEGYGDYSSNDGEGTPVYLDYYKGELRLLVWADINSEEPTHTISLEGARESLRKPESTLE